MKALENGIFFQNVCHKVHVHAREKVRQWCLRGENALAFRKPYTVSVATVGECKTFQESENSDRLTL